MNDFQKILGLYIFFILLKAKYSEQKPPLFSIADLPLQLPLIITITFSPHYPLRSKVIKTLNLTFTQFIAIAPQQLTSTPASQHLHSNIPTPAEHQIFTSHEYPTHKRKKNPIIYIHTKSRQFMNLQ